MYSNQIVYLNQIQLYQPCFFLFQGFQLFYFWNWVFLVNLFFQFITFISWVIQVANLVLEGWFKYSHTHLFSLLFSFQIANPFLFDIVIDQLYKASVADISIVENFTELAIDADQDLIDQAEDTMTILSKYIDNLTLNVESDKLKGLMRELYVEALNTETEW